MPTTEWCAPDAALPSELLRLVEGIGEVLEGIHTSVVRIEGEKGAHTKDELVLPTFDALSEYVERAIREGLAPPVVADYLEQMGFQVGEYDSLTHEFAAERVEREDVREIRLREDVSKLVDRI